MATIDTVFAAVVCLTLLSSVSATVLILIRDDRPGSGREKVAVKLAQIALLGITAILTIPGYGE